MPSKLKKRVRERMAKTGESYQTALRNIRAKETRKPTAKTEEENTEEESQ